MRCDQGKIVLFRVLKNRPGVRRRGYRDGSNVEENARQSHQAVVRHRQ